MNKVSSYLKKWNLTAAGDLIDRESSILVPVVFENGPAFLKIFKKHSDEANSSVMLRYYNGDHAAFIFQGDKRAILIERLSPGTPLKTFIEAGEDDKALSILIDVVQGLHQPRTSPKPKTLIPLKTRWLALFKKAKSDHEQGIQSLYLSAAVMADKLLAGSIMPVVLHGDIHYENILLSQRGWLAIDPMGLSGEFTYEFANTLCNPFPLSKIAHNPERMRRHADLITKRVKLDYRKLLEFTFVHGALAASWTLNEGGDPAYWLICAEIAQGLLKETN